MRAPSTRLRSAVLIAVAAGVCALDCSREPIPRLVFNASDSVPRGWYAISAGSAFRRGEEVLLQLPRDIASYAAQRGYLPSGVPLLKPVIAAAGDLVCIRQGAVFVDGTLVARTLTRDGRGRPLPVVRICRVLVEGEVFVLAAQTAASFDSRYFGPVDRTFIRGRAQPLWVEHAPTISRGEALSAASG